VLSHFATTYVVRRGTSLVLPRTTTLFLLQDLTSWSPEVYVVQRCPNYSVHKVKTTISDSDSASGRFQPAISVCVSCLWRIGCLETRTTVHQGFVACDLRS
jgi:hypothetical protein